LHHWLSLIYYIHQTEFCKQCSHNYNIGQANAEKKGEENDSFRDKATSSKEWEAQSDNFGTSDECKSPGSNSNIQPSDHTLTVSDGNSNAELVCLEV